MKKLLLLSISVAFAINLQAQNNKVRKVPGLQENVATKMRLVESANIANNQRQYVKPVHTPGPVVSKTSAITSVTNKIACGNSFNVLGLLLSEGNSLTANQDLNTVLFTQRACSE